MKRVIVAASSGAKTIKLPWGVEGSPCGSGGKATVISQAQFDSPAYKKLSYYKRCNIDGVKYRVYTKPGEQYSWSCYAVEY